MSLGGIEHVICSRCCWTGSDIQKPQVGPHKNHSTAIIHDISHQYNRDFEAFRLRLNHAFLGVSQQLCGLEINFKNKEVQAESTS